MKTGTRPSQSLRLLLRDTSRCSAPRSSRRGLCIQCRQETYTSPGIRQSGGSLRSNGSLRSLSPTARPRHILPAAFIAGQRRGKATVHNGMRGPWNIVEWKLTRKIVPSDDRGPMSEYNSRVENGRLRDDEHQRGKRTWYTYQDQN